MKIDVYFESGTHQTFIVHKEILVIEFQQLAERIGGCIKKITFGTPPR